MNYQALAIEKARAAMVDVVSSCTSVDWFGEQLVEKELISRELKAGVLQRQDNNKQKVSQLIDSVKAQVKHTHTPGKYESFLSILEGEPALSHLVQTLKDHSTAESEGVVVPPTVRVHSPPVLTREEGSSIKETNPTIHAQKVPTITDSRKRPLTEPEGEQSLKKKKRQKQKDESAPKKRSKCGECKGCQTKEDCGECKNCKRRQCEKLKSRAPKQLGTAAPQTESMKSDTTGIVETLGQPVETLGQPAETLGQPAETLGQPAETLGQPLETLGQPAETLGQPLETLGQLVETLGQPVETLGQPVEKLGQPVETLEQPEPSESSNDSEPLPSHKVPVVIKVDTSQCSMVSVDEPPEDHMNIESSRALTAELKELRQKFDAANKLLAKREKEKARMKKKLQEEQELLLQKLEIKSQIEDELREELKQQEQVVKQLTRDIHEKEQDWTAKETELAQKVTKLETELSNAEHLNKAWKTWFSTVLDSAPK